MPKGFYTFNNYLKINSGLITASMEDYIEMIYRLSNEIGFTRVGDLSKALNVKPASITNMIKKLDELSLVSYEKYGYIKLTDDGKIYGEYLLYRHNTIEKFLRTIGVSKNILEETEKIEHVLNKDTFQRIENFIEIIDNYPIIKEKLGNNKK
ncbi:DtxR family transcriptional regulator [Clostridium sp. Sa3CUN1]|uniref:Manganese transport regulator n=1 Tax=Clostridium gallinarum TaxID=2762246 RepID=A0ABR8Q0B0_9CLOT|nr:iron dependent repressor, metal binding and dimerization domain protein [Clostridium gallinarum]MBD7913846.1 DtxR family transcriptional regulator [Clostridium gallinarum]